jgi:hypothetical protein
VVLPLGRLLVPVSVQVSAPVLALAQALVPGLDLEPDSVL